MAVEVTVIVGREGGGGSEFAGEHAGGERDADDGRDAAAFRLGEELLGWPLAEHVEDDLDGGYAGELHGLHRLLDLLDADAVVADLSRVHQIVHCRERFGPVVNVRWRAVELDKVERLDAEVLERAVDEGGQVRSVVSGGGVRVQAAAGLSRDVERRVRFATEALDETLGASVAVN